MSSKSDKIKLFASIFPWEVKVIFIFESATYISEAKNYITETIRGMNLGSFTCGKITNSEDYVLLNTLRLGEVLSNNETILVYDKQYKINEKSLGGRKNSNWYTDTDYAKRKIKAEDDEGSNVVEESLHLKEDRSINNRPISKERNRINVKKTVNSQNNQVQQNHQNYQNNSHQNQVPAHITPQNNNSNNSQQKPKTKPKQVVNNKQENQNIERSIPDDKPDSDDEVYQSEIPNKLYPISSSGVKKDKKQFN